MGIKSLSIDRQDARAAEVLDEIDDLFIDLDANVDYTSIREILKVEVRKSIQHSHQVHLGTNKYDPDKVEDSLKSVSSKEEKMNQKLKDDFKSFEGMLEEKLEEILNSLEIGYDNTSDNYRQLRRYIIDLYLLRFDFTRNLINETGRTNDDFRIEVEEKLKVHLFPELQEQLPTK